MYLRIVVVAIIHKGKSSFFKKWLCKKAFSRLHTAAWTLRRGRWLEGVLSTLLFNKQIYTNKRDWNLVNIWRRNRQKQQQAIHGKEESFSNLFSNNFYFGHFKRNSAFSSLDFAFILHSYRFEWKWHLCMYGSFFMAW